MKKKAYSLLIFLFISLHATAQSSLFIGTGPSLNHIAMDISPGTIPYFDALHRASVNAEVLYGYRFPNRWQLLAGAGMFSIKTGVEAGYNIQPQKTPLPLHYFKSKSYMNYSTITPLFLSTGAAYSFLQKPYFEADASLMLDGVYLKKGNMMPFEDTTYGTYFLFDQFEYNHGWSFFLQPGIRFKKISRNHMAYWIKIKSSLRANSVLEVSSSALQHDNQHYEARIRSSGSTFAVLAGMEFPLSRNGREKGIRPPKDFDPKRQILSARVGLSNQYPGLPEDSGDMLRGASHIGGYVAVSIEERIKGPLYIGTGLTHYTLSTFYKFSLPSGNVPTGSSGSALYGIPVSLAWYQTKKKWSARYAASLGYIALRGGGINTEGSTVLENGDRLWYKAETIKHKNSTLYMDFDISVNYSLSERFSVNSFMGYSHGLKPLSEKQVTYQYNAQQQETARMNFGLNHLNFGLGLRFAIMKY